MVGRPREPTERTQNPTSRLRTRQRAQRARRVALQTSKFGFPMGRGARDAYRRVPRDASDPPWSMGTDLGEERAEHGRSCSPKLYMGKPTNWREGSVITTPQWAPLPP